MFSPRIRLGLGALVLFQFSLLLGLAWARFSNVHQRTFDLALYARVAWGLAHADGWSPVLNSSVLGAHISPVLLPLGCLGRLVGVVPVLLAAQAACVALSVWPLARIAGRRLGNQGALLAGAAWLLYPNLGHVATYEFHPGTLAVLPMAWAMDALDCGKLSQLAWSCLAVLACREDLGGFCVLAALVLAFQRGERRALGLALACLVYSAAGTWLTAAYGPSHGSLSQHFGVWGGSPLGVVRALFTDPTQVIAHFSERERLLYLPRILAPLSFFSLRAPHLLLPALPYLALNLISEFPTADKQFSHYLTPAVPALVAAGLAGISRVQSRNIRRLWFVTLGIGHSAMGGLPLSRDFDRAAFQPNAATHAARAVLAQIPEHASVQAPDPLLPHLAERKVVRRAPPPDAGTDYVVLDVSHRTRFARREDLLRTSEEPGLRTWLARSDHGVVVYAPPYALLARGQAPREAPAVRSYFVPQATESFEPRPLTRCLALIGAELSAANSEGATLTLTLRALAPCPSDLALHLGTSPVPSRTDLLFDGVLSPAHLRAGDVLQSRHALSKREAGEFRAQGLFVSVLRQSGARPEPQDPVAVQVPLR